MRPVATVPLLDDESREWLRSLRAEGAERDEAIGRLHALLLRAARFEVARRRPALPHVRGDELDDIATEAAAPSPRATRASAPAPGPPPPAPRAASRPGPTSSRCSRPP